MLTVDVVSGASARLTLPRSRIVPHQLATFPFLCPMLCRNSIRFKALDYPRAIRVGICW